jgi:hypothetical protein
MGLLLEASIPSCVAAKLSSYVKVPLAYADNVRTSTLNTAHGNIQQVRLSNVYVLSVLKVSFPFQSHQCC